MLDDFLIQLYHEGNCLEAYKLFGAHPENNNGVPGVRFTVYAPNARSVQVVGDFNQWNGDNYYMERYYDGGIWTLFIKDLEEYDIYKYRIETPSGAKVDRSDPYAFFSELRPATASKVFDLDGYKWHDKRWMNKRTKNFDKNMNIYEVNLGSWKIKKEFTDNADGEFFSYEEMADQLIPYVKSLGFTHIELMPLNEFPFDGSWGYQATGYFSATSRYGNPHQLMYFIEQCHKNDIGVIMDMVLAHFVKDGHGLHMFDGGCVYEYGDFERRYSEWDSVYFDCGKEEIRSFLMSAVHFWAEMFHIDGFRFDAVSNMLYWRGNKLIGQNDGAIELLKRMNNRMNELYPSVMMIAEDSTDFPYVTKPVKDGGIGFDYKWDMGWMNDTLRYFKEDPVYRQYDHNLLTFSMMYYYSEKFILPFSHDEVVHSKGTILDKMWGNNDQKFAQVKALYIYMMTHPGKKLNFMGNELAEYKEWDERKALGWKILDYPQHNSFHQFFKDLNKILAEYPSLWKYDYNPDGFKWLVVDDNLQSVFSYARFDDHGNAIVVVCNFIGNSHEDYTIPVPFAGSYKEILNSDKDIYTGGNYTNTRAIRSKKGQCLNEENSIKIKLAPFSACIFEYKKPEIKKRIVKKKK
ncbi:1,4-alpha-glucan branching enzyme [Eggerthia catenaformis OT 569 = DSM 20559]|uniref:1,4-alpha-glucan branching enzyme n=1 Tax=Eggerthia catenaformis OT 569 = DSM 20559 TaxID=999415 RepID=M2PLS6_9FIRM|nr:1,4-alpha-glucan branching protein GlgB [Eggerthia catenaformis]EMD16489.1 1,4-alpha-glucan branching enzyme [Eggerthia catenaformis OT 569 = DSM 20559]